MIFPGRGNGGMRFLAAVFILLTAAFPLFGRGSGDTIMSQADRLIAGRDYNGAILLLSNYMRENPEYFREGQIRLRRIVRIREQFNQIVHLLLDTLETDPENSEKILEFSTLLLAIESPANPTVWNFLNQIRYIAEFNVNRKRLQEIFLTARERLREHDFTGALAVYESGLVLFQDTFFASGYGQEAEAVASWGLADITRNIQEFNALAAPFAQAARNLAAMDSPDLPDPVELWALYGQLSPMLQELAVLRTDFLRIQESYDAKLAILQREHNVQGDRSFLAFAGWLITGPLGQQEGMTGTLEQFWHFLIDPALAALANIASRSYEAGFTAMADFHFSEGLSLFENTTHYITLAGELLQTADSFVALGGFGRYPAGGEMFRAGMAGDYLRLQGMERSRYFLAQAAAVGLQGAGLEGGGFPAVRYWQEGTLDAPQAISIERDMRASLQAMLNELLPLYTGIDAAIERARLYEETPGNVPGSVLAFLDNARHIILDLSRHIGAQEFHSAVRMYTIANGDLARRVTGQERLFYEGNVLIHGSAGPEDFGVIVRHPSEGVEHLNRMSEGLQADIAFAGDLLAQYGAEDTLAAAEMNALHASAQNYLARLLSVQNRSMAAIVSGRTLVERANALRVDADRLFQAAQAALARNDFDSARANLLRAIDQYDSSLAIQESAALRTFRDANAVNFGAEIVRAENEIVVRNVRELVTAARASYFAGNMEQAEGFLIQAQNRWRVTNVTEQPEVEHWLRLVRGALSLDLARNIPPTAPLFAEVSQLLSNANRTYNEGVSLINAGRRQEGLARFNRALEKTREVRIMFPMNHSARMLELRIEQRTDTEAFNASFQQRINQAVAGSRARNVESFADLQDLAAINPQFPGIRSILAQAEIDMGFRMPPPDPADIARSTDLTRTAEVHVTNRDPVFFAVAQAQLEEAIRLNTNNIQAQTLMDQLHILMTGTGTFVLSSQAQAQYNIALQEFLRGNYLSANAIVQQLLQDPESRRSTLIQDLRRRIDALL